MDTQTLKTFITLTKLKNFTLTAEELFVAQSTVTNRIAELEREIGKQLFIRDRRSLTLTKEGELFLNYAIRILDLEGSALHELHTSPIYESHLRIGTTNTIYECHLYPKILELQRNQRDIALKIIIGHSTQLHQMLQDQLLDVAYTYLPLRKNGYSCTPFLVDELVLVTAPCNPLFENGISKDALTSINYLFCNFALQEVGQFIKELFPPYYQFSFEIDNSTKLLPYLINGIGYSFLPESLVKPYLENGQLAAIKLLDLAPPKINSYRIHRKDCMLKGII